MLRICRALLVAIACSFTIFFAAAFSAPARAADSDGYPDSLADMPDKSEIPADSRGKTLVNPKTQFEVPPFPNQSHAQGFIGERIAAETLVSRGHTLLSDLPAHPSDTVHPGGFDIVTIKDGWVHVIDNKAYDVRQGASREELREVSAFSPRRYQLNLHGDPDRTQPVTDVKDGLKPFLQQKLRSDPNNPAAATWRAALDAIDNNRVVKAVTNARIYAPTREIRNEDGTTRVENRAILSSVSARLGAQGVQFIDVRPDRAQGVDAAKVFKYPLTNATATARPSGNAQVPTVTAAAPPRPQINGSYQVPSPQYSQRTYERYKSIPGGLLLEGAVAGLGKVSRVQYDPARNALLLDSTLSYVIPVTPEQAAVLFKALAADDRVGVSIGTRNLSYGAVPADSEVARDMLLVDGFLGDIVFPGMNGWSIGYRFPDGFIPRKANTPESMSANFLINGIHAKAEGNVARIDQINFEVRYILHAKEKGTDGDDAPELTEKKNVSAEYVANATHLANKIGYYRNEPIVDRIFKFAEVASFARFLKESGVDLAALAQTILRRR
jgi:hypothetical protein